MRWTGQGVSTQLRGSKGTFVLWACYPPDVSRQCIPEIRQGYGDAAILFKTEALVQRVELFASGQLCCFDRYETKGETKSGRINKDIILGTWFITGRRWEDEPNETLMTECMVDRMKGRHIARTGTDERVIVTSDQTMNGVDLAYLKKLRA